jgi:hypothetical protein
MEKPMAEQKQCRHTGHVDDGRRGFPSHPREDGLENAALN